MIYLLTDTTSFRQNARYFQSQNIVLRDLVHQPNSNPLNSNIDPHFIGHNNNFLRPRMQNNPFKVVIIKKLQDFLKWGNTECFSLRG